MKKSKLVWQIVITGAVLYGVVAGVSRHVQMNRLAHNVRYGNQEEQIAAAKELMARDRLYDKLQEMPRLKRMQVVRTVIRRIPGTLTVKQCLILLKDPRKTVRNRVAAALVVLGRGHIDLLVPALRDSDENVRKGVGNALVAIGPPVIPRVGPAVKDKDLRAAACDVLVRIGAPSVAALVGHLEDEDQDVRMAAAEALGKIGSREATPALLASTRDIAAVRRVAVSSLCTICDPRATDLFIEVLGHTRDDGEVRARAARALSVIGGERAVGALVRALDDFDLKVRTSVVTGLQRAGAPAIGPVVAAIAAGSEVVRHSAAAVLEKIDSPTAAAALLKLASDPDPVMRLSAAKGLGEQWTSIQVEALVRLLGDQDGRVANAAGDSLALLGTRAVPRLVSVVVSDASGVVKYRAANALGRIGSASIPALLGTVNAGGDSARWAAYALGQVGDARAKAALQKLAKSDDPETNWTASRALERL